MNAKTLTEMLPELIAGRNDAWSRVCQEMNDALVRYAMGLGLNEHDAEDCVSQAWANAIRAFEKGGEREMLHPSFFYRAVRNEALRWLRKIRRHVSLDGLEDHVRDKILSQLGTTDEPAATFDDFGKTIKDVLGALNEREQILFKWRYVEGLTLKATGEKLGMGVSGAKSLETRMLDKLRRWFGCLGS